jgi:hypothetical protein
MNRKATISVVLLMLMTAVVAVSANVFFAAANDRQTSICGSGQYTAVLTGWDLDGKTPKGEASYDSNKNQLSVSVENVKLKNGTVLDVLEGDDKLAKMGPLNDGSATASITVKDKLDEKSRIRVLDDDRPIVSANLACDTSQSDQD